MKITQLRDLARVLHEDSWNSLKTSISAVNFHYFHPKGYVVVNLVLEFFFSGDLSSFCCSPATFPIASSRKINAAAISMLLKLRIRNNPFVLWI
ncbi:hypothetical protein RB195_012988 [Necator americanus]|uniref:Uncharacterized protein n=1 Tax=Necator americanus TaxID=51031 RepID=A0ABR1DTK7_NECAM